jgi:hypothetical protein
MDEDHPAVLWPSCLMPLQCTAPPLTTGPAPAGGTLKACADSCTANPDCHYWMFDNDDTSCKFFEMLIVNPEMETPNFVTGDRACAGTTGWGKFPL